MYATLTKTRTALAQYGTRCGGSVAATASAAADDGAAPGVSLLKEDAFLIDGATEGRNRARSDTPHVCVVPAGTQIK